MRQIWYHGGCNDGFCAAMIAWNQLKRQGETKYIGVNYGEPMPPVEVEDEIYIVDFSYPKHQLIDLHMKVNKLVVLDHHKTAQADCEGLEFCIFDMNKCGAHLAWDYFNPALKSQVPLLVRLIEDRDLWLHKYPDSGAAYEGLKMLGLFNDSATMAGWTQCLRDYSFLRATIQTGRAIVEYNRLQVKLLAKQKWIAKIDGLECLMVNATNCISELGAYLNETYLGFPFAAIYRDTPEGRIWSLRSKGDFDVSAVAKKFGGGGHKNAAGFKTAFDYLGELPDVPKMA